MIRLTLIALFLCGAFSTGAQIRIYKGRNAMPSDLLYLVENNTIYKYQNSSSRVTVLSLDGEAVLPGDSRFSGDRIYTIREGKIYNGDGFFASEPLYTIQDGKIYNGGSTFRTDCLFTLQEGFIYKGDSSSVFDVLMNYTGEPDATQLLLIAVLIGPF